MSYFPGFQIKQWQFVSGVVVLDGLDHGGEFFRGSAGFPATLPSPVLLVGVHLTYLEPPGCSGAVLNPNSYGYMSCNTDPRGGWHARGGSPQNQTVAEEIDAFDIGRLEIKYGKTQTHFERHWPAPLVLNDNDGLVLDQVGYGGGNVQCIWNFVYLLPLP